MLLLIVTAVLCYLSLYWYRNRQKAWLPNAAGRAIMITGCDSGFGAKTALRLADQGCVVFAACLTEKGMNRLSDARPENNKLYPLIMDVRSDISVKAAVEKVKQVLGENGQLWALINNAAIELINGPDDWLSIDHYRDHMDVNCFGHIRVTHAFKPLLKKAEGRLIFTTSIKGRLVFPETGPYTLAKWALEAYADCLRRELFDFNVSVHVIEPGGFATALLDRIVKEMEKLVTGLPQSVKDEWGDDALKNRVDFYRNIDKYVVTDTTAVIDAFVHAALAQHPKYRYVVGADAVQYLLVSYLPEYLQDCYWRWKLGTNLIPARASVTR